MIPLMKTLKSFKEAKLIRYIIYDILITLLLGGIFTYLAVTYSGKLLTTDIDWIRSLLKYFSGTFAIVITWFMLPVIIPLISGFFEENIIERVEKTYYNGGIEKKSSFWRDLIHDIKFTFISLFLNILVIPWYYFGIGFIISLILNAYLLGKEFFVSAAGYTLGKDEAEKLLNKHKIKVYTGGFIINAIALVPILNLFIPIIAIVWMVHLYHHIRLKDEEKAKKKQEKLSKTI